MTGNTFPVPEMPRQSEKKLQLLQAGEEYTRGFWSGVDGVIDKVVEGSSDTHDGGRERSVLNSSTD